MSRTLAGSLLLLAVVSAGCGVLDTSIGGTTTTTVDPSSPATSPVTTTTELTASSTTTTIFERLVPLPAEPPPWRDVSVATGDGVSLYGRYWEGDGTAVVLTHEFDSRNQNSSQARPPQSSELLLPWSGVLAAAGHSVLSIDWRGHGASAGDYDVAAAQLDLAAAVGFLEEAGHDRIFVLAFFGSGPVVADLVATDPAVDLAGLGLLWAPPQEMGFDALRALPAIDAPVLIIGLEGPVIERWSTMLANATGNLWEAHVFPPVPTGLQFIDVYGAELAGRLLEFIESA